MPGTHLKKHCFKMNDKTGLFKIEKKKNGNKSTPYGKHCFKKASEEGGAYRFMGGMAGPMNPYGNKGK